MKVSKKSFLTDILLENGLITDDQLDNAIKEQEKTDKKIGQILVDLGYIKEDELLKFLSQQLNIPYIDLKSFPIQPEVVKLLPEFYARHHRAIVLRNDGDSFLVGMVDPQNLIARDEIRHILKRKLSIALIREEDLLSALSSVYKRSEQISHFAAELSAEVEPTEVKNIFAEQQDFASEDLPVVNMIRSIFEDAVRVNASDIHIEPGKNSLHIRLRVDGALQEQIIDAKEISKALVQRIKLMSGMNIAEKRLPQDGRFSVTVDKKYFDVRVSVMPTQYGESVVMRLLNQSASLLKLKQIGMPHDILNYFQRILTATYGMIVIVGPTGSGKTTTLYAALNELNSSEEKIITVEDPVEYRLSRINQVQVNTKIDLTFANVLRSILRQDPDIIMIGEIRDVETMEIAIRAAMTGHLVLATLHTHDTISSVARFLDMGAKGYLLASVLRAIIAQRLVRKICQDCIIDDVLTSSEKTWLNSVENGQFADNPFKKGKGCASCNHTGYSGRACVFELLPMTEKITDAIRCDDTSNLKAIANEQPIYHTLVYSGLTLAKQGITTIREVIRMAGEF